MREHDHKVHCMMNSGKPLTKRHADVLLLNAVDMFEDGRKMQRIKSRDYDGMIESNLEVIDHMGVPVVEFVSYLETERWRTTMVDFIIRVEDLQCPPHEWNHLLQIAFHLTPDEVPAIIKEHVENGGDPEDAPRLRFHELPAKAQEYIHAMHEDEYRRFDLGRQDHE